MGRQLGLAIRLEIDSLENRLLGQVISTGEKAPRKIPNGRSGDSGGVFART